MLFTSEERQQKGKTEIQWIPLVIVLPVCSPFSYQPIFHVRSQFPVRSVGVYKKVLHATAAVDYFCVRTTSLTTLRTCKHGEFDTVGTSRLNSTEAGSSRQIAGQFEKSDVGLVPTTVR